MAITISFYSLLWNTLKDRCELMVRDERQVQGTVCFEREYEIK